MDTTETTRKPPLPEALRRPLVVGDKEQINALREYEKMIEAIEAGEIDPSVDLNWIDATGEPF